MPVYLDSHTFRWREDLLQKIVDSPRDEFGAKTLSFIHIKDSNRGFCFIDAPDILSVENHHDKAGVKCDWITEVRIIKPSESSETVT
jgi:hypothetical protein